MPRVLFVVPPHLQSSKHISTPQLHEGREGGEESRISKGLSPATAESHQNKGQGEIKDRLEKKEIARRQSRPDEQAAKDGIEQCYC